MHRKLIPIAVVTALYGAGAWALTKTQAPVPVEIIAGKDRPILLARMVVTATPLDDQPATGPSDGQDQDSGGR